MSLAHHLESLRDDVSSALRQMKRAPAFTALAAATLALGIGANGAIFALVDATLLRPLPVHEPDRLVYMWERTDRVARGPVSPLNLLDWNERSRTFTGMAGFLPRVGAMVMAGGNGIGESVSRQWVSSGFFEVLGVRPLIGRVFGPADDVRGAGLAVVLHETYWRTRFGGDPAVVGRVLRLDGEPYTIVGVAPAAFHLLGRTNLWAVLAADRDPAVRTAYFMRAIGRLRPGVSLEAANADLATVSAGLARELPATNTGRAVTLAPLHDTLIGHELRLTSLLFLGVVGFVLLICCGNLANLLLARAAAHHRELAIRSALGASRRRLARQLIVESLLLAGLGGLLGLALGALIVRAAPAIVPPALLPPAVTLLFDLRVAAFCAAASLGVGLIFGVAPAWLAAGAEPRTALAADARTMTTGGGRLRALLVAGEVATAVVLLAGAGLLLRTLLAVETADRGYRAERVLTMLVDPLGSSYPTRERLLQFYEGVTREVAAVPGVGDVAWTTELPLTAGETRDTVFDVAGQPAASATERPAAEVQAVSPGYFRVIDLPLVAGRAFTERDTAAGPPVCIVNDVLARTHVRDRAAIGVRLILWPAARPAATPTTCDIVGVARHLRGRADEREAFAQIYLPMAQRPSGDTYLVIRAAGEAAALAPAVRAAIARIDGEQLVGVRDVMTLDEVAAAATERHRFRAVLVATFALVALALAMVGVFGIVGYAVQQRMRDVAVRRALGATSGNVIRLVTGGIAPVFGAGLAVGLLAAAALGGVLSTVLYDVHPLDPLTFGTCGAVLALAGALAIAVPVRRALRVDPATALRQ